MYNTDLPTRAELPSTGKLLRSTGIAALIAAALLITTVLPAEYGIDPTGIGRALGLTPMGEIKVSLAAETAAAESPSTANSPPTMDAVPADVPAHANAEMPAGMASSTSAPSTSSSSTSAPSTPATAEAVPERQNRVTIKLKPGEAAEIKLGMRKDASVRFEWSTQGGPVNYDTHGDPVGAPKNFYHGYGKGRNETAQAGTLQAAFDGKHGWFWRNRSGAAVTVILETSGDYDTIERVL